MARRSTVQNTEYDGSNVIANPDDLSRSQPGEYIDENGLVRVGVVSPGTIYETPDGELTSEQPDGRSKIILVEGDVVTEGIARRLNKAIAELSVNAAAEPSEGDENPDANEDPDAPPVE